MPPTHPSSRKLENRFLKHGKKTGNRSSGKYYGLQAQTNHPNFSYKLLGFQVYSRETESRLFQASLGIVNTSVYLQIIGKANNNICNFCVKGRQNVQHLLLQCQNSRDQKNRCFQGIKPIKHPTLFCTKREKEASLKIWIHPSAWRI